MSPVCLPACEEQGYGRHVAECPRFRQGIERVAEFAGMRPPILRGAGACPRCAGYVAVSGVFTESEGPATELCCIACGWSADLDRFGNMVVPPTIADLKEERGPHKRIRHPILGGYSQAETARCGVIKMNGERCRQLVSGGSRCYYHPNAPRRLQEGRDAE